MLAIQVLQSRYGWLSGKKGITHVHGGMFYVDYLEPLERSLRSNKGYCKPECQRTDDANHMLRLPGWTGSGQVEAGTRGLSTCL